MSTLVLCTSVRCLRRAAAREVEREAHAPLDAETRVDRSLRRDLVRRALAQEPALARVGAFGVLAHDEEVDAVVVAVRARLERPQVHVEIEREAHPQQQPALEHAGRDVGRADRAEQDRVEAAQLVEDRVGQHLTGREVATPAEVVVGRVERDTRRADDLQRLGRHLGTDAVPADDPDPVGHLDPSPVDVGTKKPPTQAWTVGANAGAAFAYGMTITP